MFASHSIQGVVPQLQCDSQDAFHDTYVPPHTEVSLLLQNTTVQLTNTQQQLDFSYSMIYVL